MSNKFTQEYIIQNEEEYPTSLWYRATALYGFRDLCKDIHIQSGFTGCPTTSHILQQLQQPALVLYSTCGLAKWLAMRSQECECITKVMNPISVVTWTHSKVGYSPSFPVIHSWFKS